MMFAIESYYTKKDCGLKKAYLGGEEVKWNLNPV